ncbi:acyl carrier protein phosphodiesterase [Lyngbya confervoides]|uniref:ACP phosphodiesterase n=1 Tax=Lyngbya confervoides BDU141951 TaxID=1574623 RepID=A0ABD4T5P1_9CYAN|nr:ACP phosphodiesterase [Lyngbya confervoides]MCM1983870.1 ACP phosphodiesterase [Lyngbya confervoides BDU141951]
MNFLAHLYLAEDSEDLMLGGLYGDFMKGVQIQTFPPGIQRGIRLHQYIDGQTDAHPVFRRSKRRIAAPRRRFSGILVDIFYDHFLAVHWEDYAAMPLSPFVERVYALLAAQGANLPGPLQRVAPRLIQEDWLSSYASLKGIALTLQRLTLRITRENSVHLGLEDLLRNYQELEQDFRLFFPELQASVRSFRTADFA